MKKRKSWPVLVLVVVGLAVLLLLTAAALNDWPQRAVLERGYFAAEVLSLVVGITTAVFVVVQISDIRRTLVRSDFDSTSQRILQISELQLRYRAEYAELMDNHISTASRSLAEAVLDIIDTELLRRSTVTDRPHSSTQPLDRYFRDLLTENPGLRRVLRGRASWYSSELLSLAPTETVATEE